MKAPYFLAIIVALLFWQCSDIQYPEKPDNLIAKEVMIEIFTDAYLSTASKSYNRATLQRAEVDLGNYIYKKYQIDSLQFEHSNAYYTAKIDEYRDMFKIVKQNLDNRLIVVDSLIEVDKANQKRRRDSLREVAIRVRDSLGLPKDSINFDLDLINTPDHQQDTVVKGKRRLLDASNLSSN